MIHICGYARTFYGQPGRGVSVCLPNELPKLINRDHPSRAGVNRVDDLQSLLPAHTAAHPAHRCLGQLVGPGLPEAVWPIPFHVPPGVARQVRTDRLTYRSHGRCHS